MFLSCNIWFLWTFLHTFITTQMSLEIMFHPCFLTSVQAFHMLPLGCASFYLSLALGIFDALMSSGGPKSLLGLWWCIIRLNSVWWDLNYHPPKSNRDDLLLYQSLRLWYNIKNINCFIYLKPRYGYVGGSGCFTVMRM